MGRKGLFHITLPGHTPLPREVRAGTPTGPEADTMEYHCLLACSPWLVLSQLSIQPRTSCPRDALPISISSQDGVPHMTVDSQIWTVPPLSPPPP